LHHNFQKCNHFTDAKGRQRKRYPRVANSQSSGE